MRKWSPAGVYLTLTAVVALANACMFTTYAVYYIRTLHLGPLSLVLVGTAPSALPPRHLRRSPAIADPSLSPSP